MTQRWTSAAVAPSDAGGFVAYGDYLELQREIERLRSDLALAQGQRNASNREIERLRDLLELDESGVDGIQCRDATIRLQADEIRKLRAKLEAVQRTVESYYEELAASQAREKVRLDALAAVVARMRETPAVQGDEFKDLGIQARAAMNLPADDSALRERLAKERERVIDDLAHNWLPNIKRREQESSQYKATHNRAVDDCIKHVLAYRALSDE